MQLLYFAVRSKKCWLLSFQILFKRFNSLTVAEALQVLLKYLTDARKANGDVK